MNSFDDKTVRLSRSPLSTEQGSDTDVATRPRAIVDEAPNALPVGTRLAEFEILGLIGEGGFGIVYLAWDTQLRRNVALKEYMPASLASRHGHSEVTVRSERHEEAFVAGLKSFVNEARMLAQFDHPALVKVHRFWEANSTAYMVMPYYEGTTLKDALRQMPAPPSEALLLNLLGPLVDALGALHRAQCFHRDISPDNIIILKDSGRPVLLDLGAAPPDHRRPDAGAHRHSENGLCACRAVRASGVPESRALDRRLCARGHDLLCDSRDDAAGLGRPHRQRYLCAAGRSRGRLVFGTLSGRGRSRIGHHARRPSTKHRSIRRRTRRDEARQRDVVADVV